MRFDLKNPRVLAMTAVMTALVLALTRIQVASTPVGGYIHLGDIAIFFTALAFGPWAGLIAGGLGAALADITAGYAIFAPLTLVVHAAQGFVVGWVFHGALLQGVPAVARAAIGVVAGALILVGGYFAGESIIPIFGGPGKAVAEVPWNFVQEAVGAAGAALYFAVARAYPRLSQLGGQV